MLLRNYRMKCSCGRVCWYILTPCCLLTSLVLVGAAVAIFLLYPSLLAQQVQEVSPFKMTVSLILASESDYSTWSPTF